MIHLWVSREAPIPIREQIATQLILGIMSGDLKPGQRLPSIRALARTVHIHPNTVSSVYQDLEARGWLEYRRGSGVYVRAAPAGKRIVDELLTRFIETARLEGLSPGEIRAAVEHALGAVRPDHVLVVDPEPALAEILAAEIGESGVRVETAGAVDTALVAVIPAREALLEGLPPGTPTLVLRLRSVAQSLHGQRRPPPETVFAVASASAVVRERCRSILIAAGVDEDALMICDTAEPGWRERVLAAQLQIADIVTARHLPASPRLRTFRVLADTSLAEVAASVALAKVN